MDLSLMFRSLAAALRSFLSNAAGDATHCALELVPSADSDLASAVPTTQRWIARFRRVDSNSRLANQAQAEDVAPANASESEYKTGAAEVIATVVGGLTDVNGEPSGLAERMLLVTFRRASTPREVATAVLEMPPTPTNSSRLSSDELLAAASSYFLAALTSQLTASVFAASTRTRGSAPQGDLPRANVVFGVANSAPRNPDLTPAGGDGGFARSGGVPAGYGVGGSTNVNPEGMWFGANNPLFHGGRGGVRGGASPFAPGAAAAAFARFDPIFPEGRGGGGGVWSSFPGSSTGAPVFPGEPNADHLRPLNNDGLPSQLLPGQSPSQATLPRGPFAGLGASRGRGGGGSFQYGW